MANIPKFGRQRRVAPDIGGASISTAGDEAREAAISKIGQVVASFGQDLFKRRIRSQAKDFKIKQEESMSRALNKLSTQLQQENPDGVDFENLYNQRADEIRKEHGLSSPSPFADEVTSQSLNSILDRSKTSISSLGNTLRNEAANNSSFTMIDDATDEQNIKPSTQRVLETLSRVEEYIESDKDFYDVRAKEILRRSMEKVPIAMISTYIRDEEYVLAKTGVNQFKDKISASKVTTLLNRIKAGRKSKSTRDSIELNSQVKDYIAAVSSGVTPQDINLGDRLKTKILINKSMKPDAKARVWFSIRLAEETGDLINKLGGAPQAALGNLKDDVKRIVNRIQKEVRVNFGAKDQFFGERISQQVQASVQLAANAKAQAREKHGVDQGLRESPKLVSLWSKALSSSADFQEAQTASVNDQLSKGVKNVKWIPSTLANKWGEALTSRQSDGKPPSSRQQVAILEEMKEFTGTNFRATYEQLVKDNKVKKEFAILSHFQDITSQTRILNNIRDYPELKERQDFKDLEDEMNEQFTTIENSFLRGRGTGEALEFSSSLKSHIQVEAWKIKQAGFITSDSSAITEAIQKVMGSDFQTVDTGHDIKLTIPVRDDAGQPIVRNNIEAWAISHLNNEWFKTQNIQVDPNFISDREDISKGFTIKTLKGVTESIFEFAESATGVDAFKKISESEATKNAFNDHLEDNAFWITATVRGKTGLLLKYSDRSVTNQTILDRKGNPIFVDLDEAQGKRNVDKFYIQQQEPLLDKIQRNVETLFNVNPDDLEITGAP